MMERFITIAQAAGFADKSPSTIWRWGKKGKIYMESRAGLLMVSESSLRAYLEPKPVVTEASKCQP